MKSNHAGPHRYIRVKNKTGALKRFKCLVLGCPHIIDETLLVGREAACNRCGGSFFILAKTLRNKYLHCYQCTKFKTKEIDGLDDLFKDFMTIPASEFESPDVSGKDDK